MMAIGSQEIFVEFKPKIFRQKSLTMASKLFDWLMAEVWVTKMHFCFIARLA